MAKHFSQIYDDLISEILVRLPVNSLLRFKSVSKSWFSLISSPNFIKSHHRLSIEKAEVEQTLIIREDRVSNNLIRYDDGESDTSIALLDINSGKVVANLNFPYSKGEVPSLRTSFVVGSASGIVCVCVDMRSPPHSYDHEPNFADGYLFIYLWNPATKQSKLIPPCTTIHGDNKKVSIGFGYDPIGDDFKVVRVSSAFAEVYSTNRNAWTKVVDPNPIDVPYDDIFNCCINGYVCSTGRSDMIAFDLNNEVLNCGIRFPVTSYCDAHITDYNDHIAVIIWGEWVKEEDEIRLAGEGNDMVRLWTLDDEACLCDSGVKASWTLKLSVEIDFLSDFIYGYFRGDLLLVVGAVWILYNCETKEEKCIQAPYVRDEVFKYTESLVSIEGSIQVSWDGNWIQDQVEDEGEGEREFMFEYDYDYEDEDEGEGEDEVEFDYGVAVEDEDEDEDEGEFDYVYEGEDGVAVEDEDADEDED